MARAALWLDDVVGEGSVFTKTQLRDAIPESSQIDRRLRELRKYGWRIDNSRDDPALKQEEQRYVAKGAEVWIPGQAKLSQPRNSLTPAQRNRVWQADHFICRTCGVGVGEAYDGGLELSKLNVARRTVHQPDGTASTQLVTECNRCGSAGTERDVDLAATIREITALSGLERAVLSSWIAADRRSLSPVERLWGIYRTLPEPARSTVRQAAAGSAD